MPCYYDRTGDIYTLAYVINGYFGTAKGTAYLNDVLARFALSMDVFSTKVSRTNKQNGCELTRFDGLKSIAKFRYRETVEAGQDNVFWAIKLYTEHLIKAHGGVVPYQIVESYAFENFIDRAKDKSTLRAKCRSIWNWYDERCWNIKKRNTMSRSEGAKKAHTKLAEDTKKKVQKAIAGLSFMQEKINIANVSRDAKVSRDTAKKYLIELGYFSRS